VSGVELEDHHHHNACEDHPSDAIDLVIRGRPRDLGGGTIVRRTLPSMRRRMVGPFIFFDHMGPVEVPAGEGMDVRPHPHIASFIATASAARKPSDLAM
jgi:redox-sensitive bicupin YhaK (pirin superfamily)